MGAEKTYPKFWLFNNNKKEPLDPAPFNFSPLKIWLIAFRNCFWNFFRPPKKNAATPFCRCRTTILSMPYHHFVDAAPPFVDAAPPLYRLLADAALIRSRHITYTQPLFVCTFMCCGHAHVLKSKNANDMSFKRKWRPLTHLPLLRRDFGKKIAKRKWCVL